MNGVVAEARPSALEDFRSRTLNDLQLGLVCFDQWPPESQCILRRVLYYMVGHLTVARDTVRRTSPEHLSTRHLVTYVSCTLQYHEEFAVGTIS
jgi:hypothetical protein